MALRLGEDTFSVKVSGTLNYVVLIAKILIALMSGRGCEFAAVIIPLTLTAMLLNDQLN